MKIVEIILPKKDVDYELSPQIVQQIDFLKSRMNSYVDKIMDPRTSSAGKEFLKSRLRDDYYELRGLVKPQHFVAENDPEPVMYEVYDRKTNQVVGGPYKTKQRARQAVDKKDLEYGAYRYAYRPIKSQKVMEAVHKLPLTDKDFELVKELMENPIPAVIAPIYIHEVIDDDELNDQIRSVEENYPNKDIRPLIAEWLERVMPDQMGRFKNQAQSERSRMGMISPIHGYDPKMFKGSSQPITGNAYGRF